MSRNISKEKREDLIAKVKEIKKHIEHAPQDENSSNLLAYIAELEKEIKSKKYGLVFEEHREEIDEILENNIPVLEENKELFINNGGQLNFLIEGDNLAALQLLEKTHRGKIDVIYIDPPYNTGNMDFIYDDKYVDANDTFRHSKWLSLMHKRISKSKTLLNKNGVIFISIDDNEFSQIKMLCDSIFDERNFITAFIWEKTQHFGRQKLNYYSNNEYVLCYAKELISEKTKQLLVESINTSLQDAPLYNRSNPIKTLTFPQGSTYINLPDGVYEQTTNKDYVLEEPVTVKNKRNITPLILTFKSRWSNDTVQTEYAKGTTFWVKTEAFAIRTIYHEGKSSKVSPKQIIFTNNNNSLVVKSRFNEKVGVNEEASRELSQIIDQTIFSYPKPVSLIKYLLSMLYSEKTDSFNKSFTCVDFFAGSGTTGHAVMELNKEDNGQRKFILCTNNENNICQDVTYERLKTVITGERKDGSKYGEPFEASLKYMKIDFVPITDKLYYEYADDLLRHIKELVELENAINFEGNQEIDIILTEDELDNFMTNIPTDCKTVYLGHDVLPTQEQEKIFKEKEIKINIIPNYYYRALEA